MPDDSNYEFRLQHLEEMLAALKELNLAAIREIAMHRNASNALEERVFARVDQLRNEIDQQRADIRGLRRDLDDLKEDVRALERRR